MILLDLYFSDGLKPPTRSLLSAFQHDPKKGVLNYGFHPPVFVLFVQGTLTAQIRYYTILTTFPKKVPKPPPSLEVLENHLMFTHRSDVTWGQFLAKMVYKYPCFNGKTHILDVCFD